MSQGFTILSFWGSLDKTLTKKHKIDFKIQCLWGHTSLFAYLLESVYKWMCSNEVNKKSLKNENWFFCEMWRNYISNEIELQYTNIN